MDETDRINPDKPKQVIVMRKDLNMRKGKMVAQGAHAAMMWILDGQNPFDEWTEAERAWVAGPFTKICVGVDSEEALLETHRKAIDCGLESYLVRDSGLTEFGGEPTYTCCAIGPNWSSRFDEVTGDLPLL